MTPLKLGIVPFPIRFSRQLERKSFPCRCLLQINFNFEPSARRTPGVWLSRNGSALHRISLAQGEPILKQKWGGGQPPL